jgi:hypothetical protein
VFGFPLSALRAENRTQKIEKYHAAEHPELVEGQAELLAWRVTA